MNQRVLLSIEQECYRELLQNTLCDQSNMEIIGQSCSFVECLALISQHQPQLWIHSANEGPDLQAAIERAYEQAPGLVIVRLNPNETAGYLQVRIESVVDVLALVERISSDPLGAEAAFPQTFNPSTAYR